MDQRKTAIIVALALTLIAVFSVSLALAQSSPNLITGQVPTAAQWNSYFAAKQDTLGYRPLNKAGDVMTGLVRSSMGAPTLSACGTGPSVRGNNQAGEITFGTGSPSSCTLIFNTSYPWSAQPICVASWESSVGNQGYTVSQTQIVFTQTGTSSDKISYICWGLQ